MDWEESERNEAQQGIKRRIYEEDESTMVERRKHAHKKKEEEEDEEGKGQQDGKGQRQQTIDKLTVANLAVQKPVPRSNQSLLRSS